MYANNVASVMMAMAERKPPHGICPVPLGMRRILPGKPRRTGVAVGDHVLDLGGLTGDPVHLTTKAVELLRLLQKVANSRN